jgi:uncharacterized protein YjbJ (UPF0337 family)
MVRQRTENLAPLRQSAVMNRDRIEGLIKQVSGSFREQWGLLTSDRLTAVAGRCEQLMGLAQARDGLKKEQAARELRDFMQRNRYWNTSGHQ